MQENEVRIKKGTVLIYRIFDVAQEINVTQVEAILRDNRGPDRFKVPKYIDRAIEMRRPPVTFGMGEEHITKYWLPWLVGMPAETSRAMCSLIFSGVMERYPNLRFAFAHGAGSFPATIGRIEHGWKVRPDLCAVDNEHNPRKYLGQFWVDSLVHDPASFRLLHEVVGTDKICCGSDYPFPLGEHRPGELIEAMQLDPESAEKMLWHNAWDWLGRKGHS